MRWLLPALLPALGFVLLYSRTLDDGFVWTDETALGAGTVLRPAGETLRAFGEPLHRIENQGAAAQQRYYRPLPVVMLSLVGQHAGGEPASAPAPFRFRALTLAVGALCAAAFGLFAAWLLGSTWAGVFAGVFVAVHPVGIESTAWIMAMPAALSALLGVGALAAGLACLRAREVGTAAPLAALSVLALALALLSKEGAAVGPVLLLAGVVCLGPRERRGAAAALVAAHFAVVAAYFFWLRPLALGAALLPLPAIGDSMWTQVLTGVASWPRQIAWLFVPVASSTSDTVRVVGSVGDPRLWLGAALALGSVAGFVALLRSGRRVAAFGLAWIWIAFGPSAGLIPLLHPSGERYLYFSAFGAALLLADAGNTGNGIRHRRVAAGLAVVLLVGLAQRTWARLPDWESTEALFEADVARDPAYREAYFLLGAEDFEAGRYPEASAHLWALVGALLGLAPSDPFAGTAGYLNWIVVAELTCQNELALGRYRRVLQIEEKLRQENPAVTRGPNFQLCHGQAQDALGNTRAALRLYLSVARQLGAATPPALAFMIGRNHGQLGERREALEWLERAKAASAGDPVLRRQIQAQRRQLDRLDR